MPILEKICEEVNNAVASPDSVVREGEVKMLETEKKMFVREWGSIVVRGRGE